MTGHDRRVAIITGGSQGIGAGLVAGYAGRGWAVVANARTIRPCADPDVVAVEGDIAKPVTADRIVEGALERFGRIDTLVNISATLAEVANSHAPSVLAALTKGGLAAATRSLAIEYAARGIRVNAVAPGIIQTSMHPAASYQNLGDELPPIGRVGQVSDVVGGILYLESAPYITGEILHVDGGQIAGH